MQGQDGSAEGASWGPHIRITHLFPPPREKYTEKTRLTFDSISRPFCMSIQDGAEKYSLGLWRQLYSSEFMPITVISAVFYISSPQKTLVGIQVEHFYRLVLFPTSRYLSVFGKTCFLWASINFLLHPSLPCPPPPGVYRATVSFQHSAVSSALLSVVVRV